jgi:hypothetical protein
VGEQDDDSAQDEKERNSVPSEIEDIQKQAASKIEDPG